MPYSICTEIRWGNLAVMKSDLCESREALWNNVTAKKTQLNVWWYFPVMPLKRPYIHLAKVLFLTVSPKWCAQCLSVSGTITCINCLSAHSRLCSDSHRHTVCWHRHLGSRWHSRNWLSLLGTKEHIWGQCLYYTLKNQCCLQWTQTKKIRNSGCLLRVTCVKCHKLKNGKVVAIFCMLCIRPHVIHSTYFYNIKCLASHFFPLVTFLNLPSGDMSSSCAELTN